MSWRWAGERGGQWKKKESSLERPSDGRELATLEDCEYFDPLTGRRQSDMSWRGRARLLPEGGGEPPKAVLEYRTSERSLWRHCVEPEVEIHDDRGLDIDC